MRILLSRVFDARCLGLGLGFRRTLERAGAATAAPAASQPFVAGTPLKQQPNVKTYGGFRFAESIWYDAERDLYVAVNAGIAQDVIPNDGYISLVNPDGTAHTLKWIGVNRNGLTLNHPLGSDIINGMLYVVDIDTVRWFDMKTGEPARQHSGGRRHAVQRYRGRGRMARSTPRRPGRGSDVVARLQDHATRARPSCWSAARRSICRMASRFDPKGNLVVVNIGTNAVLTFSPTASC